MFTLDTNAILYWAQNEPHASAQLARLFASQSPVYVSAVSVTEAFSTKLLPPDEHDAIEHILGGLIFVPVDMALARHAADLRARHGLKLGDAMIAATALFTNSTLVTRNVRDFKRVSGLTIKAI